MKKGYVRMAIGLAGLVAVVMAAALLAIVLLEDRILFHPSRIIESEPSAAGLGFEKIRLGAPDGETITGWILPAPDPPATILFMHGNAGNISHRLVQLERLRRAGFAVAIIDYRGFGESTGSPSEAGLYLDARALWDEMTLRRGVPPETILLYGESIGSAAALRTARDLKREGLPLPMGVVLEGAFTSGQEMGRRIFPFLPMGWLARGRLDNLSAIGEIGVPTLHLHGTDDEVIPFRLGRALHDASPSPLKEFHPIDGAMHNTIWRVAGDRVPGIILAFAERCLKRP